MYMQLLQNVSTEPVLTAKPVMEAEGARSPATSVFLQLLAETLASAGLGGSQETGVKPVDAAESLDKTEDSDEVTEDVVVAAAGDDTTSVDGVSEEAAGMAASAFYAATPAVESGMDNNGSTTAEAASVGVAGELEDSMATPGNTEAGETKTSVESGGKTTASEPVSTVVATAEGTAKAVAHVANGELPDSQAETSGPVYVRPSSEEPPVPAEDTTPSAPASSNAATVATAESAVVTVDGTPAVASTRVDTAEVKMAEAKAAETKTAEANRPAVYAVLPQKGDAESGEPVASASTPTVKTTGAPGVPSATPADAEALARLTGVSVEVVSANTDETPAAVAAEAAEVSKVGAKSAEAKSAEAKSAEAKSAEAKSAGAKATSETEAAVKSVSVRSEGNTLLASADRRVRSLWRLSPTPSANTPQPESGNANTAPVRPGVEVATTATTASAPVVDEAVPAEPVPSAGGQNAMSKVSVATVETAEVVATQETTASAVLQQAEQKGPADSNEGASAKAASPAGNRLQGSNVATLPDTVAAREQEPPSEGDVPTALAKANAEDAEAAVEPMKPEREKPRTLTPAKPESARVEAAKLEAATPATSDAPAAVHGRSEGMAGAPARAEAHQSTSTPGTTGPSTSNQATLQSLPEDTVRSVRLLVTKGEQTLTIRMVPESLGEVRLEVRTHADGVSVRIASANPAVRQALERQMPALREALLREGIQVGRVEVSASSQSPSSGNGTAGHSTGHHSGSGRSTEGFVGSNATNAGASNTGGAGNGSAHGDGGSRPSAPANTNYVETTTPERLGESRQAVHQGSMNLLI